MTNKSSLAHLQQFVQGRITGPVFDQRQSSLRTLDCEITEQSGSTIELQLEVPPNTDIRHVLSEPEGVWMARYIAGTISLCVSEINIGGLWLKTI